MEIVLRPSAATSHNRIFGSAHNRHQSIPAAITAAVDSDHQRPLYASMEMVLLPLGALLLGGFVLSRVLDYLRTARQERSNRLQPRRENVGKISSSTYYTMARE